MYGINLTLEKLGNDIASIDGFEDFKTSYLAYFNVNMEYLDLFITKIWDRLQEQLQVKQMQSQEMSQQQPQNMNGNISMTSSSLLSFTSS